MSAVFTKEEAWLKQWRKRKRDVPSPISTDREVVSRPAVQAGEAKRVKRSWDFENMLKEHERVWWSEGEGKWCFRDRWGSSHEFTKRFSIGKEIMGQQKRTKTSAEMKSFVDRHRASVVESGGWESYAKAHAERQNVKIKARTDAAAGAPRGTSVIIPQVQSLPFPEVASPLHEFEELYIPAIHLRPFKLK